MQIDFQMSGGFANIRKIFTKNTDDLSSELRSELLDLIDKSGILDLKQEDLMSTKSIPDAFNYKISLSDKSKKTTIVLNDLSITKNLRPLIERLKILAIHQ